jgi:hypothetical protein
MSTLDSGGTGVHRIVEMLAYTKDQVLRSTEVKAQDMNKECVMINTREISQRTYYYAHVFVRVRTDRRTNAEKVE